MCTVPIVSWLNAVISYVTHVCVYILPINLKYLANVAHMPNLVGTVISSTYLAITCEVCIVIDYVLAYICSMLGLYAHLIFWLCDLHIQCGRHICSVIDVCIEFMPYIE